MGRMKELHQTITGAGYIAPLVIEYAVMVDGAINGTYASLSVARRDARMIVENAVTLRGECVACVEVVPFIQFEPEVFSGQSVGFQ